MDTQDVNVISNNVDYQKLLKDYESLLTERQIELDKLQGINSILENKIKVLLTNSKTSFLIYSQHILNSVLILISFCSLLTKLLTYDISTIVDSNLKSNEALQKSLLDANGKLTNVVLDHIQKVVDSNGSSPLWSVLQSRLLTLQKVIK